MLNSKHYLTPKQVLKGNFFQHKEWLQNKVNKNVYLTRCRGSPHSKNCVYLITCQQGGLQYVGETGNTILVRFTQHRYNKPSFVFSFSFFLTPCPSLNLSLPRLPTPPALTLSSCPNPDWPGPWLTCFWFTIVLTLPLAPILDPFLDTCFSKTDLWETSVSGNRLEEPRCDGLCIHLF